jgi:hypothetical protein
MSHESIYKWIEETPVIPEKPPMYRSRIPHDIPLTGSTIKIGHGKHTHVGSQLKHTINPTEFLRAHEKDTTLDPNVLPAPFHMTTNLPPVPRRDERPFRMPPSAKNFVEENAVNAILAPRRSREKAQPVDWLKTEKFGKVPEYLDTIKQELENERDLMVQMLDRQQMESESAAGVTTREMSEDERHDLLDALKRKWDTVNDKYQVISHRKISTSNSTKGEIRWKETCEAQMSQLEKDINKLSGHGPIYIIEKN